MHNAETMPITPEEQLAKLFHETYERLAPHFGYETRQETAIAWEAIPATSPNKRLMIAVCRELLASGVGSSILYEINTMMLAHINSKDEHAK